jgi:hypothetical protein
MNEEQKDLLTRALNMTEIELRAALITIINDAYTGPNKPELKNIVFINVDAAYNKFRRTGIKNW